MRGRGKITRLALAGCVAAVLVTLPLVLGASGAKRDGASTAKLAGGYEAAASNEADRPGEGPAGGYEAYLSAARTYPANVIPPAMVQIGRATSELQSPS